MDNAILRLDSIYAAYDFIYGKHCIKALQITALKADTIRAGIWLKQAFLQGVPLWILRRNHLTAKVLTYPSTVQIIFAYDSLRAVYQTRINKAVANRIDALLLKDQKKTHLVNNGFLPFRHTIYGLLWIINNKRQFKAINKITDRFGFPGERLIGFSSWFDDSLTAEKFLRFDSRVFTEDRAYVMLIHYYSYGDRDMDKKLKAAINTGNMRPWQYGTLNDYRYTYGNKKNKHTRYGVWSKPKETSPEIEHARYEMGLNTLSVQIRNEQVERQNEKTDEHHIITE